MPAGIGLVVSTVSELLRSMSFHSLSTSPATASSTLLLRTSRRTSSVTTLHTSEKLALYTDACARLISAALAPQPATAHEIDADNATSETAARRIMLASRKLR